MSLQRFEEKLDKIIESQSQMRVDVAKNTVDLAHHIKRTDMLENKMQKIVDLLMVGAGIGLALYGPQFLELVKALT